jgi:hypothetical protein
MAYRAGNLFFIDQTGIQILHGSSAVLDTLQGGLFDPIRNLLDMGAKVLQQDLLGPEIALHSFDKTNLTQRPAKNQTVEAT